MALSPAEIDEMKGSGELKIAVAAAVLKVSKDVSEESSAMDNHAARLALAKSAVQSSDNMRDEFLALLLSRVATTATFTGSVLNSATPADIGLTQADVESHIAAGWNLFIDA